MSVIDLESARRRRQGFAPMQADSIDLKVYDNLDGRAHVALVLGEETEELLLHPETLRAWAGKLLAVADQIDPPAPMLALVDK